MSKRSVCVYFASFRWVQSDPLDLLRQRVTVLCWRPCECHKSLFLMSLYLFWGLHSWQWTCFIFCFCPVFLFYFINLNQIICLAKCCLDLVMPFSLVVLLFEMWLTLNKRDQNVENVFFFFLCLTVCEFVLIYNLVTN